MDHHLGRPNVLIRWIVISTFYILKRTFLSRWVRRAGPVFFFGRYCVKVVPLSSVAEAETMRFIAQNTTIPVPKVYCAFEHRRLTFTVMETIRGQILWDGWVHRPQESKDRILAALNSLVQQLRNIPNPGSCRVCNSSGGPINDQRLPNYGVWGPFVTVRDFHLQLCDGLPTRDNMPSLPPDLIKLVEFYNRQWPSLVFTHGDLYPGNIIVQGDEIVGITDWETSGWMPPYWEYTSAWNVNPQTQFWQKEVEKFLTPHPEALEIERVRRHYYGDY